MSALPTQGLHHLVLEVVDNAIDRRSFMSAIEVTIHADKSVRVVDNGRAFYRPHPTPKARDALQG
jgi:DNA gyrase/topoisomerase IV subunit B